MAGWLFLESKIWKDFVFIFSTFLCFVEFSVWFLLSEKGFYFLREKIESGWRMLFSANLDFNVQLELYLTLKKIYLKYIDISQSLYF